LFLSKNMVQLFSFNKLQSSYDLSNDIPDQQQQKRYGMTDIRNLPPLRKFDDSIHPENNVNPPYNPTYNPTYTPAYVNSYKDPWQGDPMTSLSEDLDARPYRIWHKCIAEFVGTLVFIYVGTMNGTAGANSGLVGAALAHGFTIFAMVASLGPISGGHFNPSVSLAITLAGKLNPAHLPFYIFSQLLGGIVGALICRASNVADTYTAGLAGATLMGPNISWINGLVTEIMLTAILCHVILLTAVDTSSNVLAPLAIGLTLALDVCAGGAITGASMNPARSLGPNIMASIFVDFDRRQPNPQQFPDLNPQNMYYSSNSLWSYHWIYYVGPILGASLAAALYRIFLGRNKNRLL
jgi:MIP family channel proteins